MADGGERGQLRRHERDRFGAFNQYEVLDLLAYLLSRGNPQDALVRP